MKVACNACSPRVCAIFFSAIALIATIISTPCFAQRVTPQVPKLNNHVVHVYLLRGLFNVFSTGMDGIRDKLKRRDIKATVHTHLAWRFLADEAIEDYRFGRVDTIMIMGHSAGATNAVDMANRIGDAGVPVILVVALDPSMRATVANNNVRWVVNLYLPDGMYGLKIDKEPGYAGVVENIELHDMVSHVTLDKAHEIQDRAIEYALKALKAGGPPTTMKKPATLMRVRPRTSEEAAAPRD